MCRLVLRHSLDCRLLFPPRAARHSVAPSRVLAFHLLAAGLLSLTVMLRFLPPCVSCRPPAPPPSSLTDSVAPSSQWFRCLSFLLLSFSRHATRGAMFGVCRISQAEFAPDFWWLSFGRCNRDGVAILGDQHCSRSASRRRRVVELGGHGAIHAAFLPHAA